MAEEARKRSRFDQTEAEPPRKSRFDRRSRSPSTRSSEPQRTRSPIKDDDSDSNKRKEIAAAKAAAAAAKINEALQAKKAMQKVDVPPIRPTSSSGAEAAHSPSATTPKNPTDVAYEQDGDFMQDIEINYLKNRYTLTKGSTQKMIKEKTGADVTTRGEYVPESQTNTTKIPLHLHVTSTTKAGLDAAVAEINQLMQQELPNLIDERRFRRREQPEQVERDNLGRRKWPEERIPIDLEPIPGFNLRAQVVGQGGSYVKYIQGETRCRVQIKGRGSGFLEHDTRLESDEQMYLHVAGPEAADVQTAKDMCLQLLDTVRESYEAFKERGPPPRGGGGHHGGGNYNGNRPPHYQRPDHDQNGSGSYGGGNGQYNNYGQPAHAGLGYPGGAQSPEVQQSAQQPQQQQVDMNEVAQWIQYYAINPEADPMKEYGGYAAMWGPWLAQQQAEQAAQQPQAMPMQAPGYAMNGAPQVHEDVPPPPPPPPPGT